MAARKPAKIRRRKPHQDRAKVTADVILETTAQILIKEGLDGLTTNHVAKRAGVSVGSIYQYFRSKEEMVVMLAERHIEKHAALVLRELAAAAEEPLGKAVHRIVNAFVQAQLIDIDLQRALMSIASKKGADKIRELDSQLEAILHATLESKRHMLADKVDTRMLAFLLVQVPKSICFAALFEHPEYLRGERIADEVARMFSAYEVKPQAVRPNR